MKPSRIGAEEYRRLQGLSPAGADRKREPLKYRNKPMEYGGARYDSQAEGRRAAMLDSMLQAGQIRGWTRQVRFNLGGLMYRVDFLVFGIDGTVWAEDVKGIVKQRDRDIRALWRNFGPCELRWIFKSGEENITARI